ncbi:MAG: (Fe-S)-binding protein [Verrucomicrobiales bacterium]
MKTLQDLDYSVLQQCMHCGMCLPTCPTYKLTLRERHSPRGRIALMRAVADGQYEMEAALAEEMNYCLGCMACETACPAGVDYGLMFETARNQGEREGMKRSILARLIRWLSMRVLFARPPLMRLVGYQMWLYQKSGLMWLTRRVGLQKLLRGNFARAEALTPPVRPPFSIRLIKPLEQPAKPKYRVGLLIGCIQDLVFAQVNRDTVDVLLAAGCEVHTPTSQGCCGSLHAHNGELSWSKEFAKTLIDQFELDSLDAIISNAAGCSSHLRHYDRLLADDPAYASKAKHWSAKLRDVHEWLVEIGFLDQLAKQSKIVPGDPATSVCYHEACHLCHAQNISKQPHDLLAVLPNLELKPLAFATECCGSAGIYNLLQPEPADALLRMKVEHLLASGASQVATGNPGCLLHMQRGLQEAGSSMKAVHPISLVAKHLRGQASSASA